MQAVDIDTSILEELDFDAVLPCEHSQHKDRHKVDEPARYVVGFAGHVVECIGYREYLICDSGWKRMTTLRCHGCGEQGYLRDQVLKIVSTLDSLD